MSSGYRRKNGVATAFFKRGDGANAKMAVIIRIEVIMSASAVSYHVTPAPGGHRFTVRQHVPVAPESDIAKRYRTIALRTTAHLAARQKTETQAFPKIVIER